MFNFATICESVKRHWVAIAIVAVLSLCAGVASSFVGGTSESSPIKHTAEATLYLTGYGYDDKETGDYNYSYSEGLMVTDARRLIVSSEVAGKVRAQYGENVSVTAPVWVNEEENSEYSTRFVYVDVTAENAEIAKEACQAALDLTKEAIETTLPVQKVEVVDAPALKSAPASQAANWGSDALISANDSSPEVSPLGISMKKIVVFLFCGLALSVLAFASYDILSRRVRSARDIERLLDLPVISSVSHNSDLERLAKSVHVLMSRSGLARVAVAGLSSADGAQHVASALSAAGCLDVSGSVDLSGQVDAASCLLEADTVLVVVTEGASSGAQLEDALKQLRIAGVPVLGAVFISEKSNRAKNAR